MSVEIKGAVLLEARLDYLNGESGKRSVALIFAGLRYTAAGP